MSRSRVTVPLPGDTAATIPSQPASPRFNISEIGASSSRQVSKNPKASSSGKFMSPALVELLGEKSAASIVKILAGAFHQRVVLASRLPAPGNLLKETRKTDLKLGLKGAPMPVVLKFPRCSDRQIVSTSKACRICQFLGGWLRLCSRTWRVPSFGFEGRGFCFGFQALH
jgi:hypothetical protein